MSGYACECGKFGCNSSCDGTDEEWELLRDKIPSRGHRSNYSILNLRCPNFIEHKYEKEVARSKHLVLVLDKR